jgi:hypothetical protein
MAIAIYGVTIGSDNPWTEAQSAAVHRACREVLRGLNPEQSPEEEEVAAYWQGRVETPHSAVVYDEPWAYSAYWQLGDDQEAGLLYKHLEAECCPLGMKIASHFSI